MKFVIVLGALVLVALSSSLEIQDKAVDQKGQNIQIREVREAEGKKIRGKKRRNKGKSAQGKKKSFRKWGNRNQRQNKRNGKKSGKGGAKGKGRGVNEKKGARKGGKSAFLDVISRQVTYTCPTFYNEYDTSAVRDYRYAKNQVQKVKRAEKKIEKLDKLFTKAATAFQAGADFYRECSDPRAVPVYEALSQCNVTAPALCNATNLKDTAEFLNISRCKTELAATLDSSNNCFDNPCTNCAYEAIGLVPGKNCDYIEYAELVSKVLNNCTSPDIEGSFTYCNNLLKDSYPIASNCSCSGSGSGSDPTTTPVPTTTTTPVSTTTTTVPVLNKIITNVEIVTKIIYRYAQTVVKSTMTNSFATEQEVTFNMMLSEEAFISNFKVTIEGEEEYVGTVLDHEEAIQKYNNATELDKIADKKRSFTMSMTVKPQSRIVFHLTYDERLERREGSYHYQIYLDSLPQLDLQLDKMSVEVEIMESKMTNMTITPTNTNNNWVPGTSDVKFDWSPQEGDDPSVMQEGIRVEYSVKESPGRSPTGRMLRTNEIHEIQMLCGHFIHWFTPDKITRNKFLIFVLDVSGSMHGGKLDKLKSAMEEILTKMISSTDYFSILTFSSSVNRWEDAIDVEAGIGVFKGDHRMMASDYVRTLVAGGGTNINRALLEGITQAELSNQLPVLKNLAPMIAFLTDGIDTTTAPDQILQNIQERNIEKIPILTLGFGANVNRDLLQRISAQTNSLSRMISDGANAQDQLEDFFREIERPTLSNVQFNFLGNVMGGSLSEVSQGQMFSGGEFVIVGETEDDKGNLTVTVSADSRDGRVTLKTTLFWSFTDQSYCQYMKKFIAYLKVKQDLKRGKLCQNATVLERAKNMALANNFATDLTSLVVEIEGGSFRTGVSGVGVSDGLINGTAGMCTPISPEETSGDSGPCKVILYSDKSYQGDSLAFSASMSDLSVWDWEDKLVSLKVEGTCQWKFFTDKSYAGEFQIFTSSQEYLQEATFRSVQKL